MRSANEIAGMVLKAARGAGLPLGSCEDLARAAPFLADKGHLNDVLPVLEMPPEAPVYDQGTVAGGHPVLRIASWLDLTDAGVTCALDLDAHEALKAAMIAARSTVPPVGPMDVADAVWATLTSHAARTLVPETEASRLAGAGAGLTDND